MDDAKRVVDGLLYIGFNLNLDKMCRGFIGEAADLIESQAADLARLRAEVERLTPRYSKEPPKAPGLHWIKTLDGIEYTHDFGDADFEKGTIEQWYEEGASIAGPIPAPIDCENMEAARG